MAELKQQYDEKLAQKEELKRKAEHTELMLDRASKLVSGLAGERIRWLETVKVGLLSHLICPDHRLLAITLGIKQNVCCVKSHVRITHTVIVISGVIPCCHCY